MINMYVKYFHRSLKAGYSINKVTQTFVRTIPEKEECYVPCSRASLRHILCNMLFVYKRRNRRGINHITGDIHYCILALFGCKSVLTIHDTVALHFAKVGGIKKLILEWLWYRLPIKYATKVVCISEETKRCIMPLTNRTDIEVIHNAIDPSFETKLKDESKSPYNVLFIGNSPNKNLERTVQALKDIPCKLTIIGKLNQTQMDFLAQSGVDHCVKSDLSDEEMIREYENCDIVTFVSLFEGFGMIVIEANKVGRPVICSNIPVLKEVAGDAALFVNPENVSDMRRGFQLLFEKNELRKSLVKKGLKNVERFDVSEIRMQWDRLYNSI